MIVNLLTSDLDQITINVIKINVVTSSVRMTIAKLYLWSWVTYSHVDNVLVVGALCSSRMAIVETVKLLLIRIILILISLALLPTLVVTVGVTTGTGIVGVDGDNNPLSVKVLTIYLLLRLTTMRRLVVPTVQIASKILTRSLFYTIRDSLTVGL